MTQYSCLACRAPIPEHPEGGLPAHGYVVAKSVAEPSGVLLRDEFGTPAAYYGRVIASLVKRGCSRRECEQYHMEPTNISPNIVDTLHADDAD